MAMKNVADIYPLSPGQTGMLYHSLAAPESGVYVDQIVYRLKAPIDPQQLESAWRQVIEERPILRSAFVWEGMERPLQIVRETVSVSLTRLQPDGNGDPGSQLRRFLAEDRRQGFDLTRAPAMRLTYLDGQASAHLIWTFHHVLLDGWSASLVMHDVATVYQALSDGGEPELADRRPFKDHIAWLAAQDQAAAKNHWAGELSGFTQPTATPAVSPPAAGVGRSTAGQTSMGASELTFDEARTTAMAEFARDQRVTLSTVIQGAWAILLSRFDDSDDVVFGVGSSGRPSDLPGAQSMIGMFIATLPSRVDCDGAQTVGPWLRRLQESQIRSREFEYSSLVDIRRWSDLPSGHDLFSSIVVVENFPETGDRPGFEIEDMTFHEQSNYPLSLLAIPGDQLLFKLINDRAIVGDDGADRLLDHLGTLLDAITADGDRRLDSLSMLNDRQRRQVENWAKGPAMTESDKRPMPDQIADVARRRSADTAVVCGRQRLTYSELDRQTEALAATLRLHGVGPGSFVGIRLDRSVALPLAIVAVQRAGGAYLPLDPAYPDARLRLMLDDSEATVLLTTDELLDRCPELDEQGSTRNRTGVEGLVLLTMDGSGAAPDRSERPRPGDPAYMIYTSGSTGRPNGVVIDHRNLAHSNAARVAYYGESPSSFLLLSSFSFDSSVVGIFWTLAGGGRLVLPAAGRELDIQHLAELISQEGVTHTLCLPSIHRLLLEFAELQSLETLSTVIVAGETCGPDLTRSHHRLLPDTKLYNEYGPTEATVWCTAQLCDPADPVVPIGRPAPGTTVQILDRSQLPAAPLAPGELYIGGPGVTSGYHRTPELTAERYVEIGGERYFRTGDLGRHRPDGCIEFLGRVDGQVKVRGVRVEIGEIEAALDAHPLVSASAVMVDADENGSYLVAHVGSVDDRRPDADGLRGHLAAHLPDPFVPDRVLVLETVPRLPNGKIDRGALPSVPRAKAGTERVTPRDELETMVADVWRGLLPNSDPGIHDDFFDIGGHSLLAVSLVERLRKATGSELRLADLLAAPSIAGQAELLRRPVDSQPWRSLVSVKPSGARPPLYLVPPAAGTALSYLELARHLDPDQPLYSFDPLGADGISSAHSSVSDMANYYLDELRATQGDGPYRLGGSCLGALVAWEMAFELDRVGNPVDRLVLLDPGPPQHGPGWSNRSFEQRSKPELLMLAARHAIRGSLPKVLGTLRHRQRYSGIRQMHQVAQRNYEARSMTVDLVLLQSAELARRPHVIERWRALAGSALEPIVMPATSHEGLMSAESDQVQRMAALVDWALSGPIDQPGRSEP